MRREREGGREWGDCSIQHCMYTMVDADTRMAIILLLENRRGLLDTVDKEPRPTVANISGLSPGTSPTLANLSGRMANQGSAILTSS